MKRLTPEEKEKLQAMLDQHDHDTEASSSVLGVSSGRRLANFIIDIVLFRVAIILLLIPFAATGPIQLLANNIVADWLFGLFLFFLYYFVSETVFQRTPAKLITGTKVVMLDGSKPDAGTIAERTLSRLVPFEPLSGLWGTWWHDSWSKTEVVSAKSE